MRRIACVLLGSAVVLTLVRTLVASPPVSGDSAVVRANCDFAVDLYEQLAKENQGKNLFFSPYSMSGALAMATEGARGETAVQMGKVLRFPTATQRTGGDAQWIPWNTTMIHSGMAALNERFNPKPVPKALRDKIAALRKDLDEANRKAAELREVVRPAPPPPPGAKDQGEADRKAESRAARKREEYNEQAAKSRKLAAELNLILAQVDQYELRVANALWCEKSYPFQQSYLDTVNKFYRIGGVFPVDFKNNSEPTRQRINAWVEDQTNKRIRNLILPGGVNKETRLVLTNAVYFKGEWKEPFEEVATKEDDFTVTAGIKVRVLMMQDYVQSARYAAFNADETFFPTPARVPVRQQPDPRTYYPGKGGFVMAELLYKGGDLSMVVIVPQDVDGLVGLEKKLSGDDLQTWIGKFEGRPVNVFMPKFKLETAYQVKDALSAMGMARVFVDSSLPNGAQFDGMCTSQESNRGLCIGEVVHKAFVVVNEKGTEAAATTAVEMPTPAFSREETSYPFTPIFRADKPFVFAIRDVKTGTILFLGRIVNPNG